MLRATLVGSLASVLLACAGVSRLDPGALGTRAMWQHPERVVEALAITPGSRVADLGAGNGYFLAGLSRAVGPGGRVYAVEVDANAVLDLTDRIESEGLDNVEVILADLDDPKLPDGRVDLVLVVNTYHHIGPRPAYWSRLRRDLSDQGRVAVIEPNRELDGVLGLFVKAEHSSSRAGVRAEMAAGGYVPTQSFDFLPTQIFEVFTPDGAGPQLAGSD